MKIKAIVSFALLSFTLSACGGEEVKTVEWWKNHDEQRSEFVEECRNNSENELSANCRNAVEAEKQEYFLGDS